MSAVIEAVAPCRADLAGGTLDIWPLGILHPGSLTVGVAIGARVTLQVDRTAPRRRVEHRLRGASVRTLEAADAGTDLTAATVFALRPHGAVRVTVDGQPPIGSGLGGSSAYGVALARAVAALDGDAPDDQTVVSLVRDLEARLLGVPTGTQDHWAALRGGALALHAEAGGERVETLAVDPTWIERRLTVFFTGLVHSSGMVNWEVMRRRLDGEPATVRAFGEIAEAAGECRAALVAADGAGVAAAIRDEWASRRRLAPEVCPAPLEVLERAAREAGALAFKACGAGGGGSVLVWHEPEQGRAVEEALCAAAPEGRILARGMVTDGCMVRTSAAPPDGVPT